MHGGQGYFWDKDRSFMHVTVGLPPMEKVALRRNSEYSFLSHLPKAGFKEELIDQ